MSQNESREFQLLQAAHYGSIGGMRFLLKKGDVNLNAKDENNLSALHWCVKKNNEDLVLMLLAAGANPNILDSKKDTPLHYAAQLGLIKIQRLLIKHGADINLVGSLGISAKEIALNNKIAPD